jgi:hypothetical protein
MKALVEWNAPKYLSTLRQMTAASCHITVAVLTSARRSEQRGNRDFAMFLAPYFIRTRTFFLRRNAGKVETPSLRERSPRGKPRASILQKQSMVEWGGVSVGLGWERCVRGHVLRMCRALQLHESHTNANTRDLGLKLRCEREQNTPHTTTRVRFVSLFCSWCVWGKHPAQPTPQVSFHSATIGTGAYGARIGKRTGRLEPGIPGSPSSKPPVC